MATERTFNRKRLAIIAAFGVLLVGAFGAGCKGFFVQPTLTSITINPNAPNVLVGGTTTLQAYGVYSDSTGNYLTSGVSWSTSDPTTATVTGTGSASLAGVAVGTATITAASQSVTNTATATVYINVSSISIAPSTGLTISGTSGTTAAPFTVSAVTSSGTIDITSGATLTVYTTSSGGTVYSPITCSYDASGIGTAGPGQYCTASSAVDGTYYVIASYTGTTIVSPAVTLTVSGT
ncbi:MAG: Ig-like domain-containing protein [Terriglobales bacterium]